MILNPSRLLAFPIPQPRVEVSAIAAAAYALSVGMGQDPLDIPQLAFTDPGPSMQIMPSMALVLAHPGFWMAHPESGVDPRAVLHADQYFQILAPLPWSGTVTSRSRIVDIVDKGPGKAALVRTETIVEDATRTPLARLLRTTFHRGGGGFGGRTEEAQPLRPAPEEPPAHIVDLATRPEQALLYRLNGDLNPLHSSPELARQAGFDRPILHGLCTMGIACHAVLRALADYRAERLRTMSLRFSGVVFPGETLRVELWDDGRFYARTLERNVRVVEGGECVVDAPSASGALNNILSSEQL